MLVKVHRWDAEGNPSRKYPDFEEILVNLEYVVAIFPVAGGQHENVYSRIHLSDIAAPYHTIHVMEPLSHFMEFEGR